MSKLVCILIGGLLVVLPLAVPAGAQGITRGGLTTASHPVLPCFYGSAYADGCLAAVASSDQQSAFFTGYAIQSGQSYSGRRPPWNVAWVDYATGYPTATPLADITTFPTHNSCSWNNAVRTLSCVNSTADVLISGYDFTSGGTSCATFQVTGTPTNGIKFTITGNKFGYANVGACGAAGTGIVMTQSTRTFDVEISHNEFNGNGDVFTNSFPTAFFSVVNAGGRVDIIYNHFMKLASRAVSLNTTGVQNISFNSLDGMSYGFTNHGEFGLHSTNGTTGQTAVNYSFNTILAGNDNYGANTSLIAATQDGTANFSSYVIDHNTLVANALANYRSSNSASKVAGGSGWAVNDTFTVTDGCSISATGKVSSVSGSAVTGVTPLTGGQCAAKPATTLATTSLSCAGGSCTGLTISDNYSNASAGYNVTSNTGTSTTGIQSTSNYLDPTGAGGCFSNPAGMTMTFSGNINLLDGSGPNSTVLADCFGRDTH